MIKNHSEETLKKYNLGKTMYLAGEYSITKISKELKMSRKWFADWMHRQPDVEIVNRQNMTTTRDDAFDTIDTEEKAYWLGFLYADGWVSATDNTIELMLKGGDIAHVQKFKKFMNCSNKIQNKIMTVKGKEYSAVRLSFKSSRVKTRLVELGCTPRKTFTVKFPTEDCVPRELLRHFVRGYIDADGSLMLSSEPLRLRLNIYGTKHFLTNLIETQNWGDTHIRLINRSHNIEYGGVRSVLDKLEPIYNNSNIYLDRKYKTFQEMKNAVYSESN